MDKIYVLIFINHRYCREEVFGYYSNLKAATKVRNDNDDGVECISWRIEEHDLLH